VIAVGSLVTWSGCSGTWKVTGFAETYDGQPGAICDAVGQPWEEDPQTLPVSELTLVGA
jgi:hypothetical protein